MKGRPPIPIKERFWSKVDKNGPVPEHMPHLGNCWVWTGTTDKDGYGVLQLTQPKKLVKAHRLAWARGKKELLPPPTVLICHHCDNPPCVRRSHLFQGTWSDNSQDRDNKKRGVLCRRGELHPRSKLSDAQAEEIRQRYVPRVVTLQALADEYGVSFQLISLIVNGKTRK